MITYPTNRKVSDLCFRSRVCSSFRSQPVFAFALCLLAIFQVLVHCDDVIFSDRPPNFSPNPFPVDWPQGSANGVPYRGYERLRKIRTRRVFPSFKEALCHLPHHVVYMLLGRCNAADGPASLPCNAHFWGGLRPLRCCVAPWKVLYYSSLSHSHSLSGNTVGENRKGGGSRSNLTAKTQSSTLIFVMRTKYLYTYTVFKTVMVH